MVMLIPVLAAAAHLARHGTPARWVAAGVALAVIDAAGLVIRDGEYFVWAPPAVLVWCLWATSRGDPRTRPASSEEDPSAREAGDLSPAEAAR
jgi:hypothetical protein